MQLNSNSPQGDLWLTDEESLPNDHQNIHVWGKYWLDMLRDHEEITHAWVGLVNGDFSVQWVAELALGIIPAQFSVEKCREVLARGNEFVFKDHHELIGGGLFPLICSGKVLGVIGLLSSNTDYFKPVTIKWLHTFSRLMADNLVSEKANVGMGHAESVVAQNLLANQNVSDALPAVLQVLADALGADAVSALRYIPLSQKFEILVTHGLAREDVAKLKFHFDAGLVGRSFGESPLWINDLENPPSGVRPIYHLNEVSLHGYLALPLLAHHNLVGALEIAWKTPRYTKTWDDDFLNRVGELVALAMEHAHILGDVRDNNEELTARYNAMIEGLSRSLELRDLETEGHTRRVSELTMQLVKHMKIPTNRWDAIRQGALLHDIGKLGIPDAILLKPGSLTLREMKVMQQHVIYGYNILSPVIDDRNTLDIALYHHEHWDGTGYPHGLRGEQIPLVARMFAIVDVYDALTSDRPYRTAWSRSQVVEYLKGQSGLYFDPQVVKLFLEIITE